MCMRIAATAPATAAHLLTSDHRPCPAVAFAPQALDVDGLWCLLGEAASSAQRALRSGLLDDAEAAALHAGLQGVRGLISRPWTLEDKQRQLAALCAAQDQLVAGCMGGVKTAVRQRAEGRLGGCWLGMLLLFKLQCRC